jgi:uncharacterized protein (DUF1501 family)
MPASIISRRSLLQLAGTGAALGTMGPIGIAFAQAATDNRLVVIMLRGAMDGVAAVPPYGDSRYHERRGSLALPMPGEADGILKLDGTFGLHPALAPIQPLWDQGQLLIVHATTGGFHTRSHFDAQDYLEMGLNERNSSVGGWLNRAVGALPQRASGRELGLALGPVVPLMMRGSVPVASWEPEDMRPPSASLLTQVSELYAKDPVLGPALSEGIKAQHLAVEALGKEMTGKGGYSGDAFKTYAKAAGGLLAAEAGPRIAMFDIGGWDTHVSQGTVKNGRLAPNFASLAAGLEELRKSLGPIWARTVVVCATEFGRTVAPNGTNGTDHGTASATFVLGGAVKGMRMAGDWPGLGSLYENRDLKGATDVRAVFKGVLRDHLGIEKTVLDARIFPESGAVKPIDGLVRVA